MMDNAEARLALVKAGILISDLRKYIGEMLVPLRPNAEELVRLSEITYHLFAAVKLANGYAKELEPAVCGHCGEQLAGPAELAGHHCPDKSKVEA